MLRIVIFLSILLANTTYAASTCDDACWRQRIYELQLQQTIQKQHKNAHNQA
jgi:hypothetical protein